MGCKLKPILKADMKEYSQSTDKSSLLRSKEMGKAKMTAWLLSRYKNTKVNVDQLLADYITIIFESTPSSAGTLFFIMGELAADPTLQDELRAEIQEIAKDGQLPATHLLELKKMDSVMRESARMHGFSHCKSPTHSDHHKILIEPQ
jgi:hypothetical protein